MHESLNLWRNAPRVALVSKFSHGFLTKSTHYVRIIQSFCFCNVVERIDCLVDSRQRWRNVWIKYTAEWMSNECMIYFPNERANGEGLIRVYVYTVFCSYAWFFCVPFFVFCINNNPGCRGRAEGRRHDLLRPVVWVGKDGEPVAAKAGGQPGPTSGEAVVLEGDFHSIPMLMFDHTCER